VTAGVPASRARAVGVAVALALAATALSFWFASHTRPWEDEGAVLTAAARILRGGVFFRNVDAYWLPGSAYLLAFGMRIFGEDLWVARALAGACYVATVLALYVLALRVVGFRGALGLGLALLCLKILGWPGWTAYFYWDLAFAVACLAVLALVGTRAGRPRWALAGFWIGLAFVFKQNVGLYLGVASLALVLVPGLAFPTGTGAGQRCRCLLPLGAGAAVLLVPLLLYFGVHGLLDELLWATFARPLVGYLPTGGIAFGEPLAWWRLGAFGVDEHYYFVEPYVTLLRKAAAPEAYWLVGEIFTRLLYSSVVIAGAGMLVLAMRRRGRLDARDRRQCGLALLAAAVAASALPRADFTHVITVYPLILLVLVALWERWAAGLGSTAGRGARGAARAALALLVLASAGLAVLHQAQRIHPIDLPRARLRVPPEYAWLETVVPYVMRTLDPHEPFFVYGHEAYLYFLTGRFFPWPFTQLYPGQTGGDDGAALAALLAAEQPAVIVRGWTDPLAGLPPVASYAPRLEQQVQAQFAPDRDFFQRHPPSNGVAPSPRKLSIWRPRR